MKTDDAGSTSHGGMRGGYAAAFPPYDRRQYETRDAVSTFRAAGVTGVGRERREAPHPAEAMKKEQGSAP